MYESGFVPSTLHKVSNSNSSSLFRQMCASIITTETKGAKDYSADLPINADSVIVITIQPSTAEQKTEPLHPRAVQATQTHHYNINSDTTSDIGNKEHEEDDEVDKMNLVSSNRSSYSVCVKKLAKSIDNELIIIVDRIAYLQYTK